MFLDTLPSVLAIIFDVLLPLGLILTLPFSCIISILFARIPKAVTIISGFFFVAAVVGLFLLALCL
jgi:hypothetical protein